VSLWEARPKAPVSVFRIQSPLGKGGMGEVYRAIDTRLNREVAIKVLPEEVAGSAERLARFEREARLLASLNHPNIAQVFGFESATQPDGATIHFLWLQTLCGASKNTLAATSNVLLRESSGGTHDRRAVIRATRSRHLAQSRRNDRARLTAP
jgi:serine/threonine protein kinase